MKKEKVTLIKPKNESSQEKNTKLLGAILSLILGIILLTNSTKAVIIVFYIIGGVFLLIGLYYLIRYFRMKKEMHIEDSSLFVLGTSALFIGIVILILSGALETFLRFIIGIILIFNGIRNFILSMHMRNYVTLGIAILLIGMGLYTILAENIVLQIVGALFIVSSITDFVSLFLENKK